MWQLAYNNRICILPQGFAHTFLIPPVALLSPRTAGTRGLSLPFEALGALESDAASSSLSVPFSGFSRAESSTLSALSVSATLSAGLLPFAPPSLRRLPDAPLPPRPLPRPRPRPFSAPRGRVGVCAGTVWLVLSESFSGASTCGCTSVCTGSSVATGIISSSNRSSPPRVCANSSTASTVSAIGTVSRAD